MLVQIETEFTSPCIAFATHLHVYLHVNKQWASEGSCNVVKHQRSMVKFDLISEQVEVKILSATKSFVKFEFTD